MVNRDLWHTFLDKHVVSESEQEAFLDYLTRPDTPPADTLWALEDAYRHFLRLGLPPVDIH